MDAVGEKRELCDAELPDAKRAKHGEHSSGFKTIFNSRHAANAKDLGKTFKAAQPFPHLRLDEFLDGEFAKDLRHELAQMSFYSKNADLFQFFQTADLGSVSEEDGCVGRLCRMLYGQEFRSWLEEVSGVRNIRSTVDVSGAIYHDTHYLLCHDDHLEGRRIAFILYLVDPDWSETNGGDLALFDTEPDTGNTRPFPRQIVRRLTPAFNSFTFFEVSDKSFHEVCEVTVKNGRLSISGWFYGDPLTYGEYAAEPSLQWRALAPSPNALSEWINPLLLTADTTIPRGSADVNGAAVVGGAVAPCFVMVNAKAGVVALALTSAQSIESIRKRIEETSSIELDEVLVPSKYKAVMADVLFGDVEWTLKGPAIKRQYLTLSNTESPAWKLLEMFSSAEFGEYLAKLCGMNVSEVVAEARKLSLFSAERSWDEDWGGVVHYVDASGEDDEEIKEDTGDESGDEKGAASDEGNEIDGGESGPGMVEDDDGDDEEAEEDDDGELIRTSKSLMTMVPKSNSLTIVLCDQGCTSFVKRLNHHTPCSLLQFCSSFREREGADDA